MNRDDYALVLNAGSSSLKFCVYARAAGAAWRLEARGQVDGIGTSPHLSAKGSAGEVLAVASRAYSPLGFPPEAVFFGVPIRSACTTVIRCPEGNAQPG